MNDKAFTDELFKRMYDLGYKFAEVSYCNIYFWKDKKEKLGHFTPRIKIECTCFKVNDQMIDIAEYLGIIDWSKVPVDTPILVRDCNGYNWERRYFAKVENDKIYAWDGGATSWSVGNGERCFTSWRHAKLAEV